MKLQVAVLVFSKIAQNKIHFSKEFKDVTRYEKLKGHNPALVNIIMIGARYCSSPVSRRRVTPTKLVNPLVANSKSKVLDVSSPDLNHFKGVIHQKNWKSLDSYISHVNFQHHDCKRSPRPIAQYFCIPCVKIGKTT